MSVTADYIYGCAQDLLKYEGETVGLPALEEARTLQWINDLQAQFFDEFYSRGVNGPVYIASTYGYDAASSTALAAASSAGATSLTINSSTALPSSGALVIYDEGQYDICTFTGNTGGVVTGIPATGQDSLFFAHEDDEIVERLYPLPSNFGRMRPTKKYDDPLRNNEGVVLDGYGCCQVPECPQGYQFSLYQTTAEAWHLLLPQGTTSGKIMVRYDRKPTTIDNSIGTLLIQTPQHWYLVYGLIALHKQALDEDYVPQKEQNEMLKIVNAALAKDRAGKSIRAGHSFFNRYR